MSDVHHRFLIFSILHFIALIIITMINWNSVFYPKAFLFFGIATICWAGLEHDYSLRKDSVFFNFLLFSIVLWILGDVLVNLNFENEKDFFYVGFGTRLLLFFLLVQRVLRFCFLKIMKYEPDYHVHANRFPDAIYSIILSIFAIISPVLVGELFKVF